MRAWQAHLPREGGERGLVVVELARLVQPVAALCLLFGVVEGGVVWFSTHLEEKRKENRLPSWSPPPPPYLDSCLQ